MDKILLNEMAMAVWGIVILLCGRRNSRCSKSNIEPPHRSCISSIQDLHMPSPSPGSATQSASPRCHDRQVTCNIEVEWERQRQWESENNLLESRSTLTNEDKQERSTAKRTSCWKNKRGFFFPIKGQKKRHLSSGGLEICGAVLVKYMGAWASGPLQVFVDFLIWPRATAPNCQYLGLPRQGFTSFL